MPYMRMLYKVSEERGIFLPALDLLIPHYFEAHYLFSDFTGLSVSRRSKSSSYFSFSNLLGLNCHIDKKETVVYLPNSLEFQQN